MKRDAAKINCEQPVNNMGTSQGPKQGFQNTLSGQLELFPDLDRRIAAAKEHGRQLRFGLDWMKS
uniref:Uncharacterized protein n=1 Tax=uncultured prokaryote TaxID=198431 RepID=A0A0H5Q557_9ZZZZ|nr:hypothetical protein [uncultured prokaryote]